jgi:predicted phage terminase large subunit-like protein
VDNLPSNTLDILEAELAARRKAEERSRVERDADAIRARCQSLLGFVREFWSIVEPGVPFVEGWAIEAVCAHLEAVTRGEIRRLLINIPPRMSKSTMVGVFWPAWEWGPKGLGHLHYLATSFSGPNVNRDTAKMGRLVASEKYQRLFGNDRTGPSGEKLKGVEPTDKWGEKLIRNSAGGQREGRPFSKTTGAGGDRLIVDDPHDTEAAESTVQREKTVRTFREGVSDRLRNPQESAIVVVMQRLHERDVSGEILKLGLGYVHLNLPMEYERTRKEGGRLVDATCRTYVDGDLFFEDPREVDGDLLFPERFPRATVEGYKQAKGSYGYAGQYQQRPAPRDGGMFKREWFEGDGTEGSSRILTRAPSFVAEVRAWDFAATAQTATNDPDRTASCRMGRTSDGRFVITHASVFQKGPADTERAVRATADRDTATIPQRIPEDPAAGGKYLVRDMVRALAGYTVRPVRPQGSKEARAGGLSTQAEFGNVWLVNGPWVQEWLDEVCNFPNGRYDDQVDAAADAFNDLAPTVNDTRSASTGTRKTAGVIQETAEAELHRRIHQQSRGFGSVPGRTTGIMG